VIRITPGPTPTDTDLRRAQTLNRLLRSELGRVRAAATAWRNGLAGLLTALIGFGLIRGRTDIRTLSPGWSVAVGVLLLIALLTGALGALCLLRAAHGRAAVSDSSDIQPALVADHQEAITSALNLRRGIALTLSCAALLVTAVGITWYGPAPHASAVRAPVGVQNSATSPDLGF
jgi:hypothetical protein